MASRDLNYVSLFSGAGGLDLGLEMAGWNTAYASDFDPFAVATLKANVGVAIGSGRTAFAGTRIERADIRSLLAKEIRQSAGLSTGELSLVAGGPPCQSWSSAGHQLGFADARGRLFDDFVRLANGLDARWLLLENVRGLLTARGPDNEPGSALMHIRRDLLNAGFQTTVGLLNSADYGVPQRRVRLFMFGFREGDAPPFPKATHAKGDTAPFRAWVPLSKALKSVGPLREEEIIRPSGQLAIDLAGILPGSGVKSPGKAERTRPGGHWGYKQGAFVADTEQSARTVTAGAQQDWVRDPVHGLRRLCLRECAAIQGFPANWHFDGPSIAQYRLIGNAVPPPLAAAVGSMLALHFDSAAAHKTPDRSALLPLPDRLQYHVRYTAREEASNGPSRRSLPARRTARQATISG